MDIIHLSLMIYFVLLASSPPAICQSTGNTLVLRIYPKDPILRVGSNVTVYCTLGNGTDEQPVATTWTDWIKNVESHEKAREEYLITNLTFQRDQYRFIRCSYNNLMDRTVIRVQGDVAKPLVKCTSLTKNAYKCEWDNELEATYTFKHRRLHNGYWMQRTLQENDTKVWSYVEGTGNQEIRVDATNNVSSASSIITYDIRLHLKPNITYRGSTMTTTSATLSWTTEDTYTGYFSESQVVYEEYSDETKETGDRIESNRTKHGNPAKMTIDGLKPGRSYKFHIRSRYVREGNTFTEWTYVGKNERTMDSRPSETVQDFESVSKDTGDDIVLIWKPVPKESRNGDILGYKIYVMNESYADVTPVNVTKTETQKTLEGIGYDVRYNICITAYNSAGESPSDCLNETHIPTGLFSDPVSLKPSASYDLKIVLIFTFVLVILFLYCGYTVLNKMDIFIKWPDPKFTSMSFNEPNFPVREIEVFDDLCLVQKRVCTNGRTCSTDEGINEVKSEVFTDDFRMIHNQSYLKIPESENTTGFKDELDGPVDYYLVSGKKPGDRPVQSLRSESDVDYIRVGTVMCIPSVTQKITGDKTAVPIEYSGYYAMPNKQAPDHRGIAPCSENGGIASCSDHGDIPPCSKHGYVTTCSDHGGGLAPCLDHLSISTKWFVSRPIENNNDGYLPIHE